MIAMAGFVRFLIVGGIATGLHYVILVVLVRAGGVDVVVASSIGFALSALVNYALNRRFTFAARNAHRQALPRFFVTALAGLGINGVVVWLAHAVAGLDYLLAQVVATGVTLFWNFTVNRLWTFADGATAATAGGESNP